MQLMIPGGGQAGAISDDEIIGRDTCFEEARAALGAWRPARAERAREAAAVLEAGRTDEARRIISKFLAKHPRDPDGLNVAAEIARRSKHYREAESYFAHCVHWAPDHQTYRYNYAVCLYQIGKVEGALTEAEILVKQNPGNLLFRYLQASLLRKKGDYAEALVCYRALLQDYPNSASLWSDLAGTLRGIGGHGDESLEAFRKAAELAPELGRVWWNLASLRTFRFTQAEIDIMEAQLKRGSVVSNRAELHYALGKAYDDVKNYGKSFENYARGNAIRRVSMDYDPDMTTSMVTRNRDIFTPELFQAKAGMGAPSNEPIFVLGMQRAGSTLVEQILGSHSEIEGVGELQCLLRVVAEEVMPKTGPDYPYGFDKLTPSDLESFGETYMRYANSRRQLGRPYFVDKCPYNLWHVGLIRLALPNAKIIDARRHPLACCYANFTVSFVFGPPLSYNQNEIGRFYADYVRLMAHFDRVQPGKIHRVIYEHLVADLETEVRKMLDFLGLPFDPACLEYWKNERSFDSFSNEQVRRPIFKDGVDRWRNYEPWLGPLKAALGPILDAYPDVPEFQS